MKQCFVFDIDGTLAIKWDRDIYDYTRVWLDTPNDWICDVYIYLSQEYHDFIVCSGREDSCREETMQWLTKHLYCPPKFLYMRKTGDHRADDIVKKEMLDEIRKEYEITAWFDDRDKVVKMLRENWVTVCQVNYWNF